MHDMRTTAMPVAAAAKGRSGKTARRLLNVGLRMTEMRKSAELQRFIVDEVTELSGALRVLLVIQPVGKANAALADGGAPQPRCQPAPRPRRRAA
jgi:hypothetical protein